MTTVEFFVALLRASSAQGNAGKQIFRELDLTDGQPKVLYILLRFDGCIQKELAVHCRVKESTLTTLLTSLEKRSLIRREKVTVYGGKRAFRIYLTDEGRQTAEILSAKMIELEAQALHGFSPEEQETLVSMLLRVEENLLSDTESK